MSSLMHPENGRNVHGRTVRIKDELYFSPKAVAKALGVSESSLKRWCDAGRINAIKTAGGHRRLTRADVVAYIKGKNQPLAEPNVLGLPDLSTVQIHNREDGVKQLYDALIAGDENRSREILVFLFLNSWEVHDIFDQVVSPAFEEIGTQWHNGNLEVFVERRACEICLNIFREIRGLVPTPLAGSPIAIGGTPEKDNYSLATSAVEITLRSIGWDARSLGSNLPFETIVEATQSYRPALVWLSVSHVEDPNKLLRQINSFAQGFGRQLTFVVGGNAITPELRNQIQQAVCCNNLSQMAALVGRVGRREVGQPFN